MDDTGTLWGLPSFVVSPGLYLHLAGGDEGFEVEQGIGFLDKAVHATLFEPQLFKEHLLVFVGFQRGDVFLGLGGDDHCFCTFCLGNLLNLTAVFITVFCRGFVHVADIEHGLGRKEEEIMSHFLLVLRVEGYRTGILSLFQHLLISLQHSGFHLLVLVASGSGFLCLGQLSLDGLKVFQLQLGINDFLVFHRVDRRTAFAHHIVVVETAQHVDNSIGLAYVSEEFVAESFTLRGTFYKARDIHNLTCGGNDTSGMYQFCEFGESLIGHGYHAHVGLYRTERKVCCLCLGTRQTIEKRGFSHIGQSHDTTF